MNSDFPVEPRRDVGGPRRTLVYFAYLGDEGTDADVVARRLDFMTRQLRWLSDLVAMAEHPIEAHVPYVAPYGYDDRVHDLVAAFGFRIDPASVLADRRNRFEYPGFATMKRLACGAAPDEPIFYCHSKGIVTLDERKMGLFRLHTRVCIEADIRPLGKRDRIDRACLFPARFGWCWYNFFWITAGRMASLLVEESTDRYHFEALVGDRRDGEAYRRVLPLIGLLPDKERGLPVQPWYRAEETSSPALFAAYDRYARMASPADAVRRPA